MESNGEIRVTNISPGAVDTELTGSITDTQTAEGVGELYSLAIDADAIARAIAFAIEQLEDVDVNDDHPAYKAGALGLTRSCLDILLLGEEGWTNLRSRTPMQFCLNNQGSGISP